MRVLLMAFLVGIVLTFFPMDNIGQDFSKVRDKAKEAVGAKYRGSELVSKDERDKEAVYNWRHAHRGIRILIFYGASKEEAADRMKLAIKFLPVGPGRKRTDFGDEAYSWESPRGDIAGIRFRKANVYIEVTAPNLPMAEGLARSLEQEIGKK